MINATKYVTVRAQETSGSKKIVKEREESRRAEVCGREGEAGRCLHLHLHAVQVNWLHLY